MITEQCGIKSTKAQESILRRGKKGEAEAGAGGGRGGEGEGKGREGKKPGVGRSMITRQ